MIKKESQFTESIKNFREIILFNKNLAIETDSDFRKKMAEFSFFRLELNIWIAKFSRNDNLNSLKLDILNIDEFLEKFWYKDIKSRFS